MMKQGRVVENCEPLILGVNKRGFVGCALSMNVVSRAREPLRPTPVNPEHNIDAFHLIYGLWSHCGMGPTIISLVLSG